MPGVVGVNDTFNRTVAAGFGTATTGQVYSIVTGTAADFNVAPSAGTMSHGVVNTRHQVSIPWGTSDFDEYMTTSVPVVATGAGIEVDLVGRQVDASNYYYCGVIFGLTGVLQGVVGKRVGGTNTLLATSPAIASTYAANTQVRVRAAVVTEGAGVRLFVKVWLASAVEPGNWTLQFFESIATVTSGNIAGNGLVGLQSALAVGNTNTLPVVISFQSFQSSSVGVPYPLSTDPMCKDPNAVPSQTELASMANVIDAYMFNTLDPAAAYTTAQQRVRVSANNISYTPVGSSDMPFDTVEFNVGTPTDLTLDNTSVALGPGVWIMVVEFLMAPGSVVTSMIIGVSGNATALGVDAGQRAGTPVGIAMQFTVIVTVNTSASINVNPNRTDVGGATPVQYCAVTAIRMSS